MNTESPLDQYLNGAHVFPYIDIVDDEPQREVLMFGLSLLWDDCFPRLMRLTAQGDPEVWYALGDAYRHGRGTCRDRDEAIKWYLRAAEAGHSRSMVRLGLCLTYPESIAGLAGAVEWFRKAAAEGEINGIVSLGFCYRDGRGVPVDHSQATQCFVKAAEAGDCHAMVHAGRMFACLLNRPECALHWFLRAAEAGRTESYLQLALLYDQRKSPIYNPVKAARWYHVVVDFDHYDALLAMLALARLYRDGVGVPRSQPIAKRWLKRALLTGPGKSVEHKNAAKMLNEMEGELL